jgi:hypothetical protein
MILAPMIVHDLWWHNRARRGRDSDREFLQAISSLVGSWSTPASTRLRRGDLDLGRPASGDTGPAGGLGNGPLMRTQVSG